MSSEYEWGEYEVYEMLDGEKHRLGEDKSTSPISGEGGYTTLP